MRGLTLGLYQTGQLARLNQMQLRRPRLALSAPGAGGHGKRRSDVNNGGVGGSPESSSLQTRSCSNALALIALHLWEAGSPGVFLAGCYNVTPSLLLLATVSYRGCGTEEAVTAGIFKRTHSIYFTGCAALRATVVS